MFEEIGKMLGDMQIERDRYKQALEKINDICEVDCDVCGFKNTRNCYGSECDEHKVNDILEISRRVLENN